MGRGQGGGVGWGRGTGGGEVKGKDARDFRALVFSSSNPTQTPNSYSKFFWNSVSILPNYSNSKCNWPLYIMYSGKSKQNFFLGEVWNLDRLDLG